MGWFVLVAWVGCAGGDPGRAATTDSDTDLDEEPSEAVDSDEEEPADPRDVDGDGAWNAVDCAPFNRAVGPGHAEDPCNGVDDDCDGDVDEGREARGFYDTDGDGFGGYAHSAVCVPGLDDPIVPDSGDCNDSRGGALVHPGAPEVCNGMDDDCDGDVDEDAAQARAWHRDVDGDGFGAPGDAVIACARPSWAHVADASDCDDRDDDVHPGATEWCNGKDDDCDGATDGADPDDAGPATWHADRDGDGFGTSATRVSCAPGAGWAADDGDCDDHDASVFPGAPEICADGRDTDCDGISACDVADADAHVYGTILGFGLSVAPLGDNDGDGFAEVAFGAAGDGAYAGSGRIHLFEGPLAGRIDAWDADAVFTGEHDLDGIGSVVTPGGDLDGDGVRDLLVRAADYGAPQISPYDPIVSTWVVSGAARGDVWLGDAVAKFRGPWFSALSSDTVAAGDLDGDGADDLVVGEPLDRQGGMDTGSTFVFSGPVAGELGPYEARTRIFGETSEDAYRPSAIEAGDVDGDGLAELLLLGGSQGWLFAELPTGGVQLEDAAVASFPVGMAHLADVDGDGAADVVGLGGTDVLVFGGPFAGEIAAESAIVTLEVELPLRLTGASVGDPDGDGVNGILVQGRQSIESRYESVGWLVQGPLSGAYALGEANVSLRWPDYTRSTFAGDLDGDGADDLVLTEPMAADPVEWAGAAYVISGAGL